MTGAINFGSRALSGKVIHVMTNLLSGNDPFHLNQLTCRVNIFVVPDVTTMYSLHQRHVEWLWHLDVICNMVL